MINRLEIEAARIAGKQYISSDKNERINAVANAVRVMATFIPAAKQRQEIAGFKVGKANTRARPKAAPATKKEK